MTSLNAVLLLVGLLLMFGIVSSRFSARLGMPVLVLFLGVGMLAGSEGVGGVAFADYRLANNLGSLALALILFDGGLRTPFWAIRIAWRPALALSTVGVLVTAGVTGLAAAWILGVPILHGLLLGAIVASTDAAVIFSVLRTSGMHLPERLAATLEVESGSNDPMGVFLTLGVIGVITGTTGSASALGALFALEFGVGAVVGIGVGLGGAWVVNRVQLEHAGLYPILVLAVGLVTFGLTVSLHGSGFLAVYVAGVCLGAGPLVARRSIFHFHDAVAWLSQIALFVMLGMLSFPSHLATVALPALAVAVVLILVARPLAIALVAVPFRFTPREGAFLAWGGLKGAVPITLATFPLTAGIEGGEFLFDVVFFVVLVSALTQGWSLPALAKRLGLAQPADPPPPLSVEIHALRHVDGDIVDYTVAPSARVAGQTLSALALPDGTAVTLVLRGDDVIIPRGTTALRPGDHAFVAMRRDLQPLIDRLFDPDAETPPLPMGLALEFVAESTLGQLHRFFGFPGPTWSETPLSSLLGPDGTAQHGPFRLTPGTTPDLVRLTVAAEEPEALPDGHR